MNEQIEHLIWYPGHDLLLEDIVRAENCYLYNSEGNRYVDLGFGVRCTSRGHGNPRIRSAIVEQLAQIAHTGLGHSNVLVEEAARAVLSLLRFEEGRCVFLCSGSDFTLFFPSGT